MSEQIELQGCEHCSKEFPIETMHMMSDAWFCEVCVADWRKTFDACEHKWSPHVDEMGDTGKYCESCSGFVRDEYFSILFPSHQGTGSTLTSKARKALQWFRDREPVGWFDSSAPTDAMRRSLVKRGLIQRSSSVGLIKWRTTNDGKNALDAFKRQAALRAVASQERE